MAAAPAAAPRASAADILANSADDVCPISADPCVVDERVEVARGSKLDFGTRTVHVTGAGQFAFGLGEATIESGSFIVDAGDGPAIHSRGRGASHSRSGTVNIRAFRECELGERQCMGDAGCDLGDCGSRRCAANPLRLCEADGDCSNGTCNHHRCSLNLEQRCDSDADCNADTCAPGFTCEGSGDEPFYCDENADCQLGSCSVGEGVIVMNGEIAGSSDKPAVVRMEAYGDITFTGDVDLHSTGRTGGGTLSLRSRAGGIDFESDVVCTGTPGGRVQLRSRLDVDLGGHIDCGGGLIDIATTATGITSSMRGVTVRSGRDIDVDGTIQVNGMEGARFGGYVHMVAKRDLRISGPGDGPQIETTGILDNNNFSGFGGRQTYETRRNLNVQESAHFVANGGPNGNGGVVEFGVRGQTLFEGTVSARVSGHQAFQVTGGGFFLFGDGPTLFTDDSEIDVSGTAESAGGRLIMDVEADLELNGLIQSRGNEPGNNTTFDFRTCNLKIGPDAEIDNNSVGGDNLFKVREQMTLASGGLIRTDKGVNEITYRSDDKKPRLMGNVSPKAVRILDPTLDPCQIEE
ncbi:MAG TPA: hypothetical protein VEC57_16380 [Candidatus Limnocylindrales bacterium]|nr:hypothetical protein [Candidatus Limnocylindrales bacterium]